MRFLATAIAVLTLAACSATNDAEVDPHIGNWISDCSFDYFISENPSEYAITNATITSNRITLAHTIYVDANCTDTASDPTLNISASYYFMDSIVLNDGDSAQLIAINPDDSGPEITAYLAYRIINGEMYTSRLSDSPSASGFFMISQRPLTKL